MSSGEAALIAILESVPKGENPFEYLRIALGNIAFPVITGWYRTQAFVFVGCHFLCVVLSVLFESDRSWLRISFPGLLFFRLSGSSLECVKVRLGYSDCKLLRRWVRHKVDRLRNLELRLGNRMAIFDPTPVWYHRYSLRCTRYVSSVRCDRKYLDLTLSLSIPKMRLTIFEFPHSFMPFADSLHHFYILD